MNIAPAPLTAMTEAQALGVLQAALPSGFSKTGLLMVAAQSAVETARWSAMYGYNFGNVTPTAAQLAAGANYFQHPETGSMKYLAFGDALSGAKAMTGWLESHGLYDAAQSGDLAGYMAALQAGSYLGTVGLTDGSGHTVSQDDYTNYQSAISSIVTELSSVTPAPYSPPGRWLAIGGSVAAVAAAAAVYLRPELAARAWKWVTG